MLGRDSAFEGVLEEYRQRIREEDERAQRDPFKGPIFARDDYLLPVGETVANLLVDIAVGLKARILVELGTSYGFSTIFLALAARHTGGHLFTYDVAKDKQAYARQRLEAAGLARYVTFRTGDAVSLLGTQPGPVDFALLDIWKDQYVPCLHALAPLMAGEGVIVADNMLEPAAVRRSAAQYREAVADLPDFRSVLLPIGQGIEISRRLPSDRASPLEKREAALSMAG